MRNTARTILVALGLVSLSPELRAYPSSIIFAPTSASLELGQVSLYAYVPVAIRPRFGTSATWIGLDAGVVPEFSWSRELRFGGLELGIDLIHGANHRDGSTYVKPIFNAKLSILSDSTYLPGIGFGIMSFAPAQLSESVNYTYLSATKSLRLFSRDAGSVTLGLGYAISASSFAFRGSPPLRDTRLGPLFGYSTPAWNGLSLSFDSLGGVSEMSSTNAAISYSINEQTYVMLGAFFSNDRGLPREAIYDGAFANLGATFEPFARRTDPAE